MNHSFPFTFPTRVRIRQLLIGVLVFFFLNSLHLSRGGGTLDRNLSAPPQFTEEELNWIQQHPVVRVAPDPSWPPLDILTENGHYAGISSDYLNLIARYTGLSFEFTPQKDVQEQQNAARRGEVELLTATAFSPDRSAYLDFTEPYVRIPTLILVRDVRKKTLREKDLMNLTVAVGNGFASCEYLRTQYPNLNLVLSESDSDSLRKVSFGETDAAIVDMASASYLVEEEGIANLRVAGSLEYVYKAAFGVRKDLPLLKQILDKGLAQIPPETRKAIFDKWVHVQYEPFYKKKQFWGVTGVVLLLILVVCLLNVSLRRLVALKTAELKNELEERIRAEAALRESEEKYRKLISTTATGYVIIDRDGRVLDANLQYVRLAGREQMDEVLNHPVLEWTSESDQERSRKAIERAFTQGAVRGLEIDYVDQEGKTTPVEINATRVMTGEVSQVLSLCRDISERRKAEADRRHLEEQLSQAQKMESIGRLAGGVAHDFNNMLAVILGHSELMIEDLPADSPLRGDLSEIMAAGERARDLTRQLLAFSRKQVLDVKVLDINPIIQGMEKMIRRLLGEDIEVLLYLNPEIGPIKADPSQIEQVLLNLCVNSRDAMPSGGTLTIETCVTSLDTHYHATHPGVSPGPYVQLTVSDTGLGMDEATIKRIFDPFFTTKEKGKGTGLGLATVYGIVKQHGGEVLVYSEPGRSTTFKIFFPQVQEKISEAPQTTSDVTRYGNGETILVIEDDASVRDITCQILSRLNYTVIETRTIQECLEQVSEPGKIDLLLSDVIMPEMNGRQLYERIRTIRPEIKVLFMSGYTENVIGHNGILGDSLRFISKPFTEKELSLKIREALQA